jgi:hypothetical protein
MASERWRNLIRELAIAEPLIQGLRDDRTFYVDGIPADWGTCDEGGCLAVALYLSRVALEQQAGKLCVLRGAHKHEFDVARLILHAKRRNGGKLPRPTHRQANFATMRHQQLGNYAEHRGLLIPVTTAVSAHPGSRKESLNVQSQ